LGPTATAIYEIANGCDGAEQLEDTARLLWKCYGEGSIDDGEATFLQSVIARRRPLGHHTRPWGLKPVGGRISSRFTPRQRQRSPDREASRRRRRMLGGSGALPNNLRCHYTEGQRSVLCIVAGEVKRHGICDFPVDKIAALAGVCRTTVQTTMHEARRLGHITITERKQSGRKNLPNVVEIISPEWRTWLRRGPVCRPDRVQFAENRQNREPHEEHRFKKEGSRRREKREREPTFCGLQAESR
jgi:hypothetical protein